MGGDRAPQIVVEGADIVALERDDVQFSFFGDKNKILPIIQNCRHLKNRYIITHTTVIVTANEKPSNAVRRLPQSSMRLAINSVKEKKNDVIVSAGNTGALMAISKIVLRPLQSINRPAIVSTIPNKTEKGTVMLDLGANIDCSAEILFQFAIMGHAYAKIVHNLENPKIGVLNVGSENQKGHETLQTVSEMLRNSHLSDDFYGFVEGDDITKDTVDVIVTDGFTGNITLKSIEGALKFIKELVRQGFLTSIFSKIGYLFSGPALNKITKNIDPRYHNGAMFVGLSGVVVKSHGSTDKIGFANAIRVAISLIEKKINEKIIEEIDSSNKNLADV